MSHDLDRRYRTMRSLRRDVVGCRRCAEAGFAIEPPPVTGGSDGRAYLFGLAPGHVERDRHLPWQGRAGRTLRGWLRMDEDTFFDTFTCASVTRCYPGKASSGRGDRLATPAERRLCRPWWENELRLLDPPLVVTVGVLATWTLLGTSRLTDVIGKSFLRGSALVIPLPHPSGASGWLNDSTNRARLGKALTHVRRELARLELVT